MHNCWSVNRIIFSIFQTQYKVPRLKKGSVPSKFPWTELIKLQEDVSGDKEADPIETLAAVPTGDDAVYRSDTHCEPTCDTSSAFEAVETALSGSASDLVSPKSNSENPTDSPPPITFEQLMASDISMPSGWNKQTVTYEDTKLIVCNTSRCAKIGGKFVTLTLKEIIVKADMTFEINVLGKPVGEDLKIDVSQLRSLEKLQDLIVMLNDLNICTGTKIFHQECRVGSAVYRDPSGTWRHANCALLVSSTLVCSACRMARKSIMAKCRRIKKCSNTTERSGLRVPSEDRSLVAKLKVKYRNAEKIALNAKAEIAKLKSTIDACEKKLSDSAKSLDEYLESTKVPENQMLALREIVAAAKRENLKGRRYSEEWLLFSMLLHMRSPAGYNFLHENQILPLPDVRTIRRYLKFE